jgi:hypothetical protein
MLRSILTACLALASGPVLAESINAKLVCGPHSGDPGRLRAFQVIVPFEVSPGRLEGKRVLPENGGGQETFVGAISSDGRVQLSGQGSYTSGASWVYEFTGMRAKNKDTVLRGKLTSTLGPVGGRECTMGFARSRPSI